MLLAELLSSVFVIEGLSVMRFKNFTATFNETFCVRIADWTIEPRQHWAIVGDNGSGKSALASIFTGEGEHYQGAFSGLPSRVAAVSLELQRQLIERERYLDLTDITNEVDEGTLVGDMMPCREDQLRFKQELIQRFNLHNLLDMGFRKLSTGQTRKLLVVQALLAEAELLVLDEVFDGLDVATVAQLEDVLEAQSHQRSLIMVCNRMDEIPDFITHVAIISSGVVSTYSLLEAKDMLAQRRHLEQVEFVIPESHRPSPPTLDQTRPLVRLNNIAVSYSGKVILEGLDWVIEHGQHWQLCGPNGSGKTTLLNLINGDHPQCYVNDITVFGFKRGSGESIWQIKQYIGYVSASLQWEYRVSISAINVLISGFYDTIGIYQKIADSEKICAQQWLALLGMSEQANTPLQSLSYGQQRLLLIARAMIKHPALLVLDEPCQGLDEINRQLVLALISRICHQQRTTVLYVNHHAADKIDAIKNVKQL